MGMPTQDGAPAIVIAEIGCNHRGDVATAKQLIRSAKECGAAYAKFQKRCPRESLTPEGYDAPYDNPNSYGRTYGEHREALEFTVGVHRELANYCREVGIGYSTSVWDLTSAREIATLEPEFIKIPSACNNHIALLELLRDHFGGQVHVSSGMSEIDEIDSAVDVFSGCPERLVLYSCTSGYPIAPKEVCLLEIPRMRKRYEGRVADIGFSGHHKGISIDIAAYMLGATTIERHFTLDRTWKGTDHPASLEPQGLAKLVRDLEAVRQALTEKPSGLLPIEIPQRGKLKYAADQKRTP